MSSLLLASLKRLASPSLALFAAVVLMAPSAARATPYVVKLVQQGNSVVATGSGAIDLTGLAYLGSTTSAPAAIIPASGYISTGPTSLIVDLDAYTGFTGPVAFGPGAGLSATSGSGDWVGVYGSPVYYQEVLLWVPFEYVSLTALSDMATYDDASFASLGVTPGTYTWTWGSGAANQSFTLIVANATSVPEPAALGMFGLGMLLIGGFVTLRRRGQRPS